LMNVVRMCRLVVPYNIEKRRAGEVNVVFLQSGNNAAPNGAHDKQFLPYF
jgi:hypothetical protein